MCGKKKCVVYKTKKKHLVKVESRVSCCKGWVFDAKDDSCSPVCSTGCAHGTCTGPDHCQCASHAYLDPELSNRCVPCEPPCHHALCASNNTCSCLSGHTAFNASHCAPHCPSGHALDADLNCQPHCPHCHHGTCLAPDHCQCHDGYSAGNGTCHPVCHPPCGNATCVAPNTCQCLPGYTKVSESACEPHCERCDGACVAPNHCQCHQGYQSDEGVCRPVCANGCPNGQCVGPNHCQCHQGYQLVDGSCRPVCSAGCPHGQCVGPNRCQCDPGYAPNESGACEPQCRPPCANATCVAPDSCACWRGHRPVRPVSANACQPEEPCLNGAWESPGLCACLLGFEKSEAFGPNVCLQPCLRDCPEDCVQGTCFTNVTCDDGRIVYYYDMDKTPIKVPSEGCCTGYIYDLRQKICVLQRPRVEKTTTEATTKVTIIQATTMKLTTAEPPTTPTTTKESTTTTSISADPLTHDSDKYRCEGNECVPEVPAEFYEPRHKIMECTECRYSCNEDGRCSCEDGSLCERSHKELPATASSQQSLASLGVGWLLGLGLVLVLLLGLALLIPAVWLHRRRIGNKQLSPGGSANLYGSIVYTVPDTLMVRSEPKTSDVEDDVEAATRLMPSDHEQRQPLS